LFVIQISNREAMIAHLTKHEVGYLIHYPIPPHQQEALVEFSNLNFPITEKIHQEVLSIPISPVLNNNEVQKIIEVLNSF
jgi:dTDP-4-amino-4,6-dideoxygalactose transaminase